MRRLIGLATGFLALIGVFAWWVGTDLDTGKMRCNGLAQLCDRRVDQVTFAGTHNSMAASKEGWYAANQQEGIPEQLRRGIRTLLIDTQYWETEFDVAGQLRNQQAIAPQLQAILRGLNDKPQPGPLLCHSFCALGYRPLSDGLADIRAFLDTNPHEVLLVIVEDYIRPDDMDQAMRDSGLLKYAYRYDQRNHPEWPTLRQMIDRGERLLLFYETGRSKCACDWYLPAFQYFEDTSFRYVSVDAFDCEPNRGNASAPFLLANHWVFSIIPSQKDAALANRYDVLKGRVAMCEAQRWRVPNVIAVDFSETGDLVRVVRELNSGRR